MMGSTSPQQNMGPPMHMQFSPAGLPQQPPPFMQPAPQQFRPVGQAMPGVNMGMTGQMPHFPQPGQHTPHSGHVPPASQAVPTGYQAARPMSSAPMQPPPQAVFPGGHMPTMGAPSYTNQPTSVPPVAQPWGTAPGQGAPPVSLMVQPGHQFLSASVPPVSSTEPSSSDWQEHSSGDGKYYYNKRTTQSSWEKRAELMTPLEENEKAAEQPKRHVAEYRAFLESCDFIKANTQWRKVREWLEDDERCFRLENIDRLNVFQEYTRDLEKEEEEQRRIQKEQTRIQERKNRIEFRRMLEEHVCDGTLHAKTHWRDYCAQVKDSHAYLAVVSNTSGSLPKVLFEDVMEELDKQYQDDKTLVKDEVKSGKIHMTASWTLQDFQAAVTKDNKCKGISNINIKLIYEDQIERLKKKELKEAKNYNIQDLLYSIKEITTSTWDDSKALFDDTQEYRDLGVEEYASELSDKYIACLKERYKEQKRMRKEEKARKEKDHEEGGKKEDKEKERKDKHCKEKERDREKGREKEKGKDQSKRDEMEVDGDDVEGSKDKKREKDKEKKHKRWHHDTTDDLGSERDEKDDSKKSRRHSNDRKHTHASDWIRKTGIEDIEGSETSSRKNGLDEELEDGELRENGEIH